MTASHFQGLLPELEASLQQDASPRNVLRVAEAMRLAEEPARAVEILAPVTEQNESWVAGRVLLSWCLAEAGESERAAEVWEDVVRLDPENRHLTVPAVPATMEERAEALEREAEPEAALSPRQLEDVPPEPLYSATLAEIFERQGFEEKAIEIYQEVLRTDPDRVDLVDRIEELNRRLPAEPGL